MAKSNAEKVRLCMARRRARARKLGLCAQCCKQEAPQGRTVCVVCSAAAVERTRRRRKKSREATNLQPIIAAHERAGDVARESHFHDGAAQHYKDALLSTSTIDDRIRISVKLVHV